MTNFKCDLCNGRTGVDYAGNNFTTIVRAHYVIMGQVICLPCINEIEKKVFTRKKLRKNTIITRNEPDFNTWSRINHKECEND